MKPFTKSVLQRTGELVIPCFALSAIIYWLYLMGIIPNTYKGCFYSMFVGVIVFAAINVLLMRQFYAIVPHRADYYKANYIACGIFILLNVIAYIIKNNVIYVCFFGITKFLRYLPFGIETYQSAIIFHVIMLIAVPAARIGKSRHIQGTSQRRRRGARFDPIGRLVAWVMDKLMGEDRDMEPREHKKRHFFNPVAWFFAWIIDMLMGKKRRRRF